MIVTLETRESKSLHKAFENKSLGLGLSEEPSRKFDYYIKFTLPPRVTNLLFLLDEMILMMVVINCTKKWDWDDSPPSSPPTILPIAMLDPPQHEDFLPLVFQQRTQSILGR